MITIPIWTFALLTIFGCGAFGATIYMTFYLVVHDLKEKK